MLATVASIYNAYFLTYFKKLRQRRARARRYMWVDRREGSLLCTIRGIIREVQLLRQALKRT
jgi:hypothetical protein